MATPPPRAPAPPPVRFDELALFVEVATAGSLAAAARRRGVPKSTVGRAIARLEGDLGVALVRRHRGGPPLTDPGRALLEQAAPHVAALRDLARGVARTEGEIHGALRVTATSDLARLVLGPLVAAFVARHPRIEIEVDASIRLIDLAREGFDLALRVAERRLPASTLVARKLARLDLGLFASPAYLAARGVPRQPGELVDHDHVLLPGRERRAPLVLDGPRGPVPVAARARIVGNDFDFARAALCAGAGIGPLSWFVARPEVAAGRLVRVLPDHRLAGATAYLIHLPLRPLPAKLVAFKRFLFEHAPPLLTEPA